MKKNQQPPTGRYNDPDLLYVFKIFPTIQGEGFFSGHPATFVRLWGCNLQCPHCDTDYTSVQQAFTPQQVLRYCELYENKLVVITGGEPFRQNLSKLFDLLVKKDFTVLVETNGTLPPPEGDMTYLRNVVSGHAAGVYISCSPKTGSVHPKIQKYALYFKYVVNDECINPRNGLPNYVLGLPLSGKTTVWHPPKDCKQTIYLSPADEKNIAQNHRNVQAATRSCMQHGYILSTQLHKTIGVE